MDSNSKPKKKAHPLKREAIERVKKSTAFLVVTYDRKTGNMKCTARGFDAEIVAMSEISALRARELVLGKLRRTPVTS